MKASLVEVAKSHTFRCDAKQSERRFREFDEFISKVEHFRVGDYLPNPMVKGRQPSYIEESEADGVPVVSTLAIQGLRIIPDACRYITESDFEALEEERILGEGDLLLTMDGGTSIGKPAVFDLEGNFSVDSHIAILRPDGIAPITLAYLLASPLGRVQFQRAESGASGQTAVTEEDVRRFRFPFLENDQIGEILRQFESAHVEVENLLRQAETKEREAWMRLTSDIVAASLWRTGD